MKKKKFKYGSIFKDSMRRKIILQGNRSFTLTLPVDWIRKYNLKSGDEVDVLETDEGLSVVSSVKKKKKVISLALPDAYVQNVKYILRQLYRQGYDRFVLTYKNEKDFDIISEVLERFVGLELIDRKEKQCTVEVVVDATEDKFEIFFRKLFQIIKESLLMVREGKSLDYLYRKFASYQDFCKRYVVNLKRGVIDYEYYSLLSYLVNIEADLNSLANLSKNSEMPHNYDKIAELFGNIEKAFFSDDFESLALMNKEIHKFFDKLLDKLPGSKQSPVLHYQLEVLRFMYGAVSPMIGIILFKTRK